MDTCNCNGPAPVPIAVTTTIISGLLSFITISGNVLICAAILKDPFGNLRTPFMYFVVNLAVSDLVTGFITMPSSVIVHLIELLPSTSEKVETLMHFMRLTNFISVNATLLSLITLSIDRYLAVAKPFIYRRHTGLKGRVAVTVAIWLISISLPMIYFATDYITVLLLFANAGVTVVFGILVFTYFKVYRTLRNQSKKIRELNNTRQTPTSPVLKSSSKVLREKDEKVTRAFLIILIVFACCYIPVIIIIYILKFYPNCNCTIRHALRDTQFILGLTFSAATPFVCALHHRTFRNAAMKILGIHSAQS